MPRDRERARRKLRQLDHARRVVAFVDRESRHERNPDSCRDVFIFDCQIASEDDCIALKSGRNDDGRRLHTPIENVIVRDCDMKDGHGGVVTGSEISGGARNIFAERCSMDSPRLDRALRIKTNSVRGGVIERIAKGIPADHARCSHDDKTCLASRRRTSRRSCTFLKAIWSSKARR